MKHDIATPTHLPLRGGDNLVMPDSGVFEVTLAQAAHYKKMRDQKRLRRKLRILMVEDQSFLRKLSQEALGDMHEIIACANAGEGWASYLDQAPDIAFLDIGLPDADGHQLAHRIKEFDPGAYVVMLTASCRPEDFTRAQENRVDGFIVKPFSRGKLDTCIGNYTSGRGK